MKMPGFTAGVSLYKTSRPYRMSASDVPSTGHVELMFHETFVSDKGDATLLYLAGMATVNLSLTEMLLVFIDVRQEFPFLVTKMSPYYDR